MSGGNAVSFDVDVRGFVYALEPARQKLQWHLDKLMADLAKAQQALAATETQLAQVQQLHDREAQAAGQALLERLNPDAHRRALGYLARLREQSCQLAEQCDALRAARDGARQACVAQQLRIESLTRHKDDAFVQYADEARQRASTERDRDWLARSFASRRVTGGSLGETGR